MPQIRGAAGSTINTTGLIVGCLLLLLVVLAFLQQQLRRRKRRTQYHPPLQLESTSRGVLEQIGRRKEDIRRYIEKLKEQLAAREDQLRYHSELEEIVTSRVETSRLDDEEWTRLMKAGRKVNGKNWNVSNGDEPSLRELMELHKDELLEYKRSLQNDPTSSRQSGLQHSRTSREWKVVRRPSKFKLPLLKMEPVAPLPSALHGIGTVHKPGGAKIIPAQWQSTRLTAQARTTATLARPIQVDVPSDDDGDLLPKQKAAVPPLDFSRLGSGPAVFVTHEEPDEGVQKLKRKSFEATFKRQTRLAAMLRKKK